MYVKTIYRTKQRERLLAYLQSVEGKHITAAEVYRYFHNGGTEISQSTVYRQLERLVDEGLLNKYIIDAGTPACFEYVGTHSHAQSSVCFHCKCVQCGKLIHLHCEELEAIGGHLRSEHGFALDPQRTVLWGLCESCQKAGDAQ